MITREQVADLRVGDVVVYHNWDWPPRVTIRGPLYARNRRLWLGDQALRLEDGDVRAGDYRAGELTVIERAPRPLYVNHDRIEPVPGDVVRDALDRDDPRTWTYDAAGGETGKPWRCGFIGSWYAHVPEPTRLLVDGTTGQVVP